MNLKLPIEFLGRKFVSPLVLPSGILTTKNDFINAQNHGAGAVTTKSYTFYPRSGHPAPVVARFEGGFINSVGLRNAGIAEAKRQIQEFQKSLSIPLFVSLFDTNIRNFIQLALHLLPLKPEFLELNLSCPNVDDEYGKPLATQEESAYEIVRKVKKVVGGEVKIIAKLTANVPDIKKIAVAVEEAGADAIAAINTVGPGMIIDIKKRKPVLGAKQGGVSGPAIKPIAIRCVYEIYQVVNIPIIGMGGVTSWQDAVEMMMAGATLIGVGSAIYLKGWSVYEQIKKKKKRYLKEEKIEDIKSLIGQAHL